MIKCSYAFALHTTDFEYSIFHLGFLIGIFNGKFNGNDHKCRFCRWTSYCM